MTSEAINKAIETTAREAAEFFSEEVDAISDVEKFEMADKIEARARESLKASNIFTPPPEPLSRNTTALIAMLHEREQRGRAKYGVTLDRTDLTTDQWLQHAIEEALDFAAYLQGLKRTLAPPPEPEPQGYVIGDDDHPVFVTGRPAKPHGEAGGEGK